MRVVKRSFTNYYGHSSNVQDLEKEINELRKMVSEERKRYEKREVEIGKWTDSLLKKMNKKNRRLGSLINKLRYFQGRRRVFAKEFCKFVDRDKTCIYLLRCGTLMKCHVRGCPIWK